MSEEVTGSGKLLSRVQKLEHELKDSERKRMNLIQSNAALQKILKACWEQEVMAQQEIASLWERLVSLKIERWRVWGTRQPSKMLHRQPLDHYIK